MATPPPPTSGYSTVTRNGPTKAAPPAPKFRIANEAPLSRAFTMEGVSADSGTNPANRTPYTTPKSAAVVKVPLASAPKYHNGVATAQPTQPNQGTGRRQPTRSPIT